MGMNDWIRFFECFLDINQFAIKWLLNKKVIYLAIVEIVDVIEVVSIGVVVLHKISSDPS